MKHGETLLHVFFLSFSLSQENLKASFTWIKIYFRSKHYRNQLSGNSESCDNNGYKFKQIRLQAEQWSSESIAGLCLFLCYVIVL